MKRSLIAVAFALLTSAAFVSGVMAQQSTPAPAASAPAKLEKFSGTVERVDEAKKEIVVKKGSDEKTFFWGDHTKFMEGKKELSFTDVKPGANVTVQYKKEGDRLVAENVSVSMAKTAAKKNPSEKSTEMK